MIAILIVVLIALFVGLALLAREIKSLRGELMTTCVTVEANTHNTAHYVGDMFAARVLRAAADDLDSAEGQAELRRLSATEYKVGGPSIGNLWLHDRADSILPHPDPRVTEYNMDGSPV